MCGIAGVLRAGGGATTAEVEPMLRAVAHRGPDGEGLWGDEYCVLGHRRLAIIDLSDAGRQPMCNEDGTLWITFNGEIYNFAGLRRELEGFGHRFHSRTDTEVILHAYEQWGEACVGRLRGMFAFAVWDSTARRLFLARDRVGKKPLFYVPPRSERDPLVFASEVQGLLCHPSVPRDLDPAAVDAYLSWGYVPAPRTGLAGVCKLPPAHWMTVALDGATPVIRTERYWRLSYTPKSTATEAEAGEELRERLSEAVRLRMVSDVPLGAFLSGGIDSSIVVGLMAEHSERPVKTFSIGFAEAAYNELDHARRIAERWGTEHHECVVAPDALDILPALVRHYGEPYADSSAIPTYYVSKITRQGVTVALNGDGGDESFAGYERYAGNRLAEGIRRLPGAPALLRLASAVVPDSADPRHRLRKVHRFLASAALPMPERYGRWVSHFRPEDRRAVYTPEFQDLLGAAPDELEPGMWMAALFQEAGDLDPVEAAMSVDVRSYLPYDLLAKVDIASMANSLEARSPFLDHQVMEYAAGLPRAYKLKGRSSKHLLRTAFADLLPPENVQRPKMGFGVPVGEWFRGPMEGLLRDTLLSSRAASRGYFRPDVIRGLIQDHVSRRAEHSFKLWTLLMLECWRQFLEESPPCRRN